MCGISGVFNYRDRRPVNLSTLRAMTDAIAHRGPDDAGFHVDGGAGFGFRRLSIIDLSTGHQPVLSEDGARAIMLNGEIYNYADVRAPLLAAGRKFLTKSDTEVVLAAYEKYGTECVDHLRGMFAIAIYDRDAGRVFLARDRLGVKPLYYSDDGSRVVFGSEIKALLPAGNIPRDIDDEAVADYLALRYVPGPKTIYKSVKKLPPGHWMMIEAGKAPVIRRYWDLKFEADLAPTESQWVEEIRAVLDESVRIRMISDVPLGAFLSGGIDSSAVVATMARLSGRPVSTHTIGFRERAYDESAAARIVAEKYKTDHHEEIVDPDALSIIQKLAWHFDEPFADSSAVPTYYVSKLARRHVTVALSGDGGDENFAGYARRYAFERRENRLRSLLPRSLRKTLFGTAARIYPKADWLPRPFRAKTMLTNLALDPHAAFFNTMSLGTAGELPSLLQPDVRSRLGAYRTAEIFRDMMTAAGTDDPVSRAQYVDIKTFLVDGIMVKVDRASMAVSLEAREPVLDHRLMELAARIPSSLKLQGSEGKLIFKKAVSDRVPDEIINRKKQGFELPVAAWFRGPLKDITESIYSDTTSLTGNYLDLSELRRLNERHVSGLGNHAPQLWSALMFHLWAKQFHQVEALVPSA